MKLTVEVLFLGYEIRYKRRTKIEEKKKKTFCVKNTKQTIDKIGSDMKKNEYRCMPNVLCTTTQYLGILLQQLLCAS